MTRYIIIDELDNGIYDDITDAIADVLTEDDYEDFLNEEEPEIRIGTLTYGAGHVLRTVDPVAFRCAYLEHIDAIAQDEEEAMRMYGIDIYDAETIEAMEFEYAYHYGSITDA